MRNRLLYISLFILCLTAAAWGQGGATGAISGTVQDASGAALANARVNIISEATSQSAR